MGMRQGYGIKTGLFGAMILLNVPVQADIRIQLLPIAHIKKAEIFLNDVAEMSSSDMNELVSFQHIKLGEIRETESDFFVEKEIIRRWTIRKLGMKARNAVWSGADKTKIEIDKVKKRIPVEVLKRDDWVTLRVVSGVVTVESKVQALQTGEVGQFVRVRKVNSSTTLLARVVDSSTVEILN